jgi:hypothetical protein
VSTSPGKDHLEEEEMPKAIVLVFTECSDATREQEFNDWYNNTHIPDMLQAAGFVGATRYQVLGNPGPGQGKFMAVYEVEADDLPGAFAGVQKRLAEVTAQGRVIDTIKLVSFTPCLQISERQTA